MSSRVLRIGTRGSELALWQANTVKLQLESKGFVCEIVTIKSLGDTDLTSPLYEMGVTGVFTKTLDIALLNQTIDIAVHSMKDVPTKLPKGIKQAGVLERSSCADVLLYKESLDFLTREATIATGSLRRKAQWLYRYPQHSIENIRGNINSRQQKLNDNSKWSGAIFAKAGLDRIGILPQKHLILDWMIPAPAQGIILMTTREDDTRSTEACGSINHPQTEICAYIERDFLRLMEGGCSAPIGAIATINEGKVYFKAGVFSPDGKKAYVINREFLTSEYLQIGKICTAQLLEKGADTILNQIREGKK